MVPKKIVNLRLLVAGYLLCEFGLWKHISEKLAKLEFETVRNWKSYKLTKYWQSVF